MSKPLPTLALSHVGLYAFDLERMEAFCARVFGYRVTDRGELGGRKMVFMSGNRAEHHQVVIVEGRTGDGDASLNHLSLRVASLADLKRFWRHISADPEVAKLTSIDHGTSWSIYFRDPEGNGYEIFAETQFYTAQPTWEPLDLSLSDDEIEAQTRARFAAAPGFKSMAEWRGSLSPEE